MWISLNSCSADLPPRSTCARATGGHSWPKSLLLTVALMLTGCAATPPRQELPVQAPERFSVAGSTQPVSARWWEDFADPNLQQLIDKAMSGNLSLRATWARLRQAEAVARREGAPLWPELNAQASISREGPSLADASEQRQVGLFASYEVDLWGRLRATKEAAAFDALASSADLQTAAITLSATVADIWYQLVEQRAQLAVIDSQIATNRQVLKLIEARFRIGESNASDIYRQRQLLAQTEGERVLVDTQLNVLTHQLSILIGTSPGIGELPAGETLPTLGPLPATGVPAELMRRRPDLQAAFLRLRAADARAAAAVAARYPSLDLSAAVTTSGDLFSTWLGNIAAQLTAPLFDGGRRRAEAERTRAVVEENLNSYGQTLLEALAEVEDALSAEAGQRAYLASVEAQLQHAEAVVGQERLRYFQGETDYFSVLDALRSRQALERQRVTAQRQLISDRIVLVRALAGGWSLTPPTLALEPKN